MRKRSLWDALPNEVLARIFKVLPFHSKLFCEAVCTSWRRVFHGPHATLCERSLTFVLNAGRTSERSILDNSKIDSEHVEICVPAFHPGQDTVVRWLSRRLQSISQLKVCSAQLCEPVGSRLLKQLIPVHKAMASFPTLSIFVDETTLLDEHLQQVFRTSCSQLRVKDATLQHLPILSSFSNLVSLTISADQTAKLVNQVCLPECLTSLKNLEALSASKYLNLPAAYTSLTKLTYLQIAPTIWQADLSGYTQVQHLQIGPAWGRSKHILLPVSDAASLQHLTVSHGHGLPAATKLTSLELEMINTARMDWPTTLTRLKNLQLRQLIFDGPHLQFSPDPKWQYYTELQKLIMPGVAPDWQTGCLPDWFSSLKKLTRLDMRNSRGLRFHRCWSQLSQLHHLDLGCYIDKLSNSVCDLAHLPHLTYLSFGDMSAHEKDEDPEIGPQLGDDHTIWFLDLLADRIQRNRVQPSDLFRINVSQFWYEWQAKNILAL